MFYNSDYNNYDHENYLPVPHELLRNASPEEHGIIFRWARRAAREKTKNAWIKTISAYFSVWFFIFLILLFEGYIKIALWLTLLSAPFVLIIGLSVRQYNISKIKMIAGGKYNVADVFLKEKETVTGTKDGVYYYLKVAVRYDPNKERRIRVMKSIYDRANTNTRLVLINPTDDDYEFSYDIVDL